MNDLTARILIYEKNGSNLRPIRIYTDDSGKKWVEARNGTKFVIEVKNNSYQKILSVISVDGLSILTGERAVLQPKNGYVVNPYSNIKLNGWRTSLDKVREFVFTANKKETYSHKLGADESNIGVIGFAFYKEKIKPITSISSYDSTWTIPSFNNCTYAGTVTNTSSAPTSYLVRSCYEAPTKEFSMGTKQGKAVVDKASIVEIDFEDAPFIIDSIYYDSRENLIAKGIIKEEQGLPQPFEGSGFCPNL